MSDFPENDAKIKELRENIRFLQEKARLLGQQRAQETDKYTRAILLRAIGDCYRDIQYSQERIEALDY